MQRCLHTLIIRKSIYVFCNDAHDYSDTGIRRDSTDVNACAMCCSATRPQAQLNRLFSSESCTMSMTFQEFEGHAQVGWSVV